MTWARPGRASEKIASDASVRDRDMKASEQSPAPKNTAGFQTCAARARRPGQGGKPGCERDAPTVREVGLVTAQGRVVAVPGLEIPSRADTERVARHRDRVSQSDLSERARIGQVEAVDVSADALEPVVEGRAQAAVLRAGAHEQQALLVGGDLRGDQHDVVLRDARAAGVDQHRADAARVLAALAGAAELEARAVARSAVAGAERVAARTGFARVADAVVVRVGLVRVVDERAVVDA